MFLLFTVSLWFLSLDEVIGILLDEALLASTANIFIIMILRVRIEEQSDQESAESEIPVQLIMSRLLSKEISLRKLSSRKPTNHSTTPKEQNVVTLIARGNPDSNISAAATSHTC